MAFRGKFQSGSVTTFAGATGLLAALLTFVTSGGYGGDWTIKYNRNTRDNNEISPSEPFGSACKEVILSNTGLSGTENILVGIREWQYLAGGAYGWDLTGYLTYATDQFWNIGHTEHGRDAYDATWEHFTELPMLPLINDTIYYWFYSDRQRIVVITKVQSNYESCYLGFCDRFGNLSDYPYPLFIKGSAFGNILYSDTSAIHAFIIDAGKTYYLTEHLAVLPDNTWNQLGIDNEVTITPFTNFVNTGQLNQTPLTKQTLVSPVMGVNQTGKQTLWEMDQVLHVAGEGVQSEDLINGPAGERYRVFQNIFRTSYSDFLAIGESDYTTTSTSTTTTTTTTTA